MNTSFLPGLGIRTLLVGTSLLIAASWTDQLLKITKHSTELVMTTTELQDFAQEGQQAVQDESSRADGEDSRRLEDIQSQKTVNEEATSPAPHVNVVTHRSPANSRAELLEPDPPSGDARDPGDNRADPVRVAQFTPIETGSLQSFQGAYAGAVAMASQTGGPRNVVWDLRLAGQVSLELLSQMHGTTLVAVRSRSGKGEIAMVSGHLVGQPTPVDRFVRENPTYQSGQGIILDRRLLQSVQDRLLTYGGGWQLWLLIEDQLFAAWIEQVNQQLRSRSWSWDEVRRVAGSIHLSDRGGSPRFYLQDVRRENEVPQ